MKGAANPRRSRRSEHLQQLAVGVLLGLWLVALVWYGASH